jgi:hypothetical protein
MIRRAVDVMRQGRRRGKRESRDDGHDRDEGGTGDHGEQERPAQVLRQQEHGRVAGGSVCGDGLRADQCRGAQARQHLGQSEEDDQAGRPRGRLAGSASAGDRSDSHQDMRQAGSTEHERQLQAEGVDLAGAVVEANAGLQEGVTEAAVTGGRVQQVRRAPAEFRQHRQHDEETCAEEDYGFDALHQGRRPHTADEDVEDHQKTEAGHNDPLGARSVHAQDCRRERSGADELGGQIQQADDHARDARRQMRGPGVQPKGERVADGEPCGAVERLGDQQHQYGPGDHRSQHVGNAVVAGERDQAGIAQHPCRGHITAEDRQPVDERRQPPLTKVELAQFVLSGGCRPDRKEQRTDDAEDKDSENGEGAARTGEREDGVQRGLSRCAKEAL